jgi:hypothetical protein
MQRNAVDDDVLPCPKCKRRAELIIVFSETFNKVGCHTCDDYSTDSESNFAITKWNYISIIEYKKNGKKHKQFELYELLYQKMIAEKEVGRLNQEVDKYLENNISTQCPLKLNDVFTDERDNSIWIVLNIKSVYGFNTGPFWMIQAESVNRNGKIIRGIKVDFWQKEGRFYKKREPYFVPTRWNQLKKDTICLFDNKKYNITSINEQSKLLTINCGKTEKTLNSLKEIKIPLSV